MKKCFTLLLLLLLGSLPLFSQTIYYVKPTGSDANPGTSWATAFRTLQKALATISSGEVWVAQGTYYPDEGGGKINNDRGASFVLKNNVTLYGGFPASGTPGFAERNWQTRTTKLSGDIDGNGYSSNNAYHVVSSGSVSNTAILDGFTVSAGNANGEFYSNGGGLYNGGTADAYASPTIRNCTFTGNQASFWGGGMYNYYASPRIINCTFSGNTAAYGGGIYNVAHATPLITNCRFSGNTAQFGAGISNINTGSPTLTNCVFSGNKASAVGGAFYGKGSYDEWGDHFSYSTLTNCTFYGNTAVSTGAIYSDVYAYVTLTNCILWGDTQNELFGANTVTWSIVQGGHSGSGNLDEDPQFIDADVGDFHLQFCSPAIEGGNTAAVANVTTDGDGAPRVAYHKVDIGAYESQQSRVLYVKAGATGLKNGTSWVNAYTSLQDALSFAASCQRPLEVWVAAGTYYPDVSHLTNSNLPTATFQLHNNLALYGGFPATGSPGFADRNWINNTTTLSGEIQQDDDYSNNAYHVVSSTSVDTTAVLDGFTITGGNAYGDAPYNKGGGLYNVSSSPTLTHCSFYSNRAVEGGALYNNGASPILTFCEFLWNRATYGGAMYNYTNAPVLTACLFSGNTASADGGALYNNGSSSTLINCGFSGNQAGKGGAMLNSYSPGITLTYCSLGANTADDGGGLYNWMSSPTLTNCILWGNAAGQIRGDDATVTSSIVQGGYPGTGNKAEDPQFVSAAGGNLHLRGCSPAINSATASGAPLTDIEGKGRPALGGFDRGAYEFQSGGDPSIFLVDKNAPGPIHDGSSWANAFTSLQAAIDVATTCFSPSQVWVATGTYYPDTTGTNRAASFKLRNNVAVYGGFNATEPIDGGLPRRVNKTTLSGEIQHDGDPANNSYHVVQSTGNDATAVLDGFIITGGNANGTLAYLENCDIGGGILLYDAAPTITNCIFRSNHAIYFGGAVGNIYTYDLVLANCLFYDNSAKWGGAIAHDDYATSSVVNCSFSGNRAEKGGAIFSLNASPRVTNSILWGNTGGQISAPQGAFVTYSIVQAGSYPGAGNLAEDPLFVRADTGNLHLQNGSPAIDAGNTAAITLYTDLDALPRVLGSRVDMGAYEYPKPPTPSASLLLLRCPSSFTLFSDADHCGAPADFTGDHAATAYSDEGPVTITYTPASGTVLPVGENTITVTATDTQGESSTCAFTVTVIDTTPPVVTCPAVQNAVVLEDQPVIIATSADGCTYRVQGSELDVTASDNCATPLTYSVSLSGATTSGAPLETGSLEGMELTAGRTTITWRVQDAAGNEATCHFDVLVVDQTVPQIRDVTATPSLLYPPNHQLQEITVAYEATDYCGAMTTTLSVTSNEPPYGSGSGDTAPDGQVLDNHHLLLRAVRSGKGSDRVYTITITAKDAAGNTSTATTTVTVPHDKGAPVTVNEAAVGKEVASLEVKAVPNPSSDGFTLQVQSPSDLPVRIKVIDAAGKVIEQKDRTAANSSLYIGSTYRPGVYYLQVEQGPVRKTIKLIKQTH